VLREAHPAAYSAAQPAGGKSRSPWTGSAYRFLSLVPHIASRPMHVIQRGAEVNDIVHDATIAVVDAHKVTKPECCGASQAFRS
jgi:hypothetical protein